MSRDIRLICRKCGRSFATHRAGAIDIVQDEECCESCGGSLRAVDPVTGAELGPGTWPEDPDYPRLDWLHEVNNGETKLDYEEWLEHKYEAEDAEAVRDKGRFVSKTCPRCGATSAGGRYCPSGCGPI